MIDNVDVRSVSRAFDLDGDDHNDFGLTRLWFGLDRIDADLPDAIAMAFATSDLWWVLQVETCDTSSSYLRASLRPAVSVDGTTVSFGDESYVPAVGSTDGSVSIATQGVGWVPLPVMFDREVASNPTWDEVVALALDVEMDAEEQIQALVGFAIDESSGYSLLAGPLSRTLNALIQEDPGCPLACEEGALTIVLRDSDGNDDGMVEPQELLSSPGILLDAGWLADVDITADFEGETVYWPGHDGRDDHMSMSIKLTATRVDAAEE